MGEVMRARDITLGRTVAIKLLPPDVGESERAKKRFLREAQAASALDHPRICTIYEIGEADDGRPFISMAYCDGETLQERIRRGPLSVDEARAITVQIAEGLAAAHAAGVVHRDIKPANIMLTPGGVKILDFGLAKLAGGTQLTRTGATMGTPAYMSPEQATGGEVDQRSDLWSLAAILYEMVTGVRPFGGDNATAIMYAILTNDPQPPAELRPEVPDEVVRVIDRGLQRDPAERYSDARELLADLGVELSQFSESMSASFRAERTVLVDSGDDDAVRQHPRRRAALLLGAAVVLIVAIASSLWWFGLRAHGDPVRSAVGAATEERPLHVVGVLPFTNRTGDPELGWMGEGLARLVSDGLAGSSLLQVVGADRIAAVSASTLPETASEIGLTAVIEGELLPGPEGLTVSARVVEPQSGTALAARRIDGLKADDLFGCADDLVAAARRGMGLPPEESVNVHTADFAAANPEAYEAYLDGLRSFVEWRYDEAERAFSEALALAPGYAMARYRLATVFAATGRTDESLSEIRRAAREADGLTDREARYINASEAYFERRFDDALAAYRELVDAYPYDTDARHLLAGLLYEMGRYDEEIAELEILARLSPGNSVVHSMMAYAHLGSGDTTNAILELQRCIELEPDSANNHHSLGEVYQAQGELDLAAGEFETALMIDPDFSLPKTSLGVVEILRRRWGAGEARFRGIVGDESAPPRARLDAAFELASVLRSRGRFREAVGVLESVAPLLEAEGVREAMALSMRGTSQMELGELAAAERLVHRSIERSPGVPTRYLFARGLLELRQSELGAVRATADEIEGHALPAGDPDRTENKAAAYLRGAALLAEGNPDAAVSELSRAVALSGYSYGVYRLELARAFLAADRLPEAMAAARQAAEPGDPADPRLDLELDRVRARLVLARVHEAMGRAPKAAAEAGVFLNLWSDADPEVTDPNEAKRIAGGAG
jgi:tetratricopeptide (TPR) repeat protein